MLWLMTFCGSSVYSKEGSYNTNLVSEAMDLRDIIYKMHNL